MWIKFRLFAEILHQEDVTGRDILQEFKWLNLLIFPLTFKSLIGF